MKRRYLWVAVLAAALPLAALACQSKPNASTTTSPPAATTTSPTGSASTPGQGRGVFGDVASINGNTLVLTTTQGQTTVNIGSSTAIEKTVTGSVSDLKNGDAVTVIGTTDSNGNIAANSIDVRPQGQSGFFGAGTGGGGRFQGGSGNGTGPGFGGGAGNGTGPGFGGAGQFTVGTIASIAGNTITLTTPQGQATVSVGTNTNVTETESGTASDLQTGDSLIVVGSRDANGDVAATLITIQPARGTAPTGTTGATTPPVSASTAGPTITTTSLPDGNVGAAYSQALSAASGSAPYTWSIAGGALPNGLSLDNSTSNITGTPAVSGTFSFTLDVTDSTGATASTKLAITIDPALIGDTLWLPAGDVGISYSHDLVTSSQGTTDSHTYFWLIPTEFLPPGLSLQGTPPAIAGTPTTPGTYSFTAQVSGVTTGLQSIVLSITINPAPSINQSDLPDGQVGTTYVGSLSATGGSIPYSWSVSEGTLPDGLSMDSYSSAIIGTPTTAGTFTFTVAMTDGNGAVATQQESIKVDPAPAAGS